MTPVYGSGIPAAFAEAITRAETRFPDVSWGITLQDGEYRLLASCGGRESERRLRECVVHNAELGAVLAHECEELAEAVKE